MEAVRRRGGGGGGAVRACTAVCTSRSVSYAALGPWSTSTQLGSLRLVQPLGQVRLVHQPPPLPQQNHSSPLALSATEAKAWKRTRAGGSAPFHTSIARYCS